MTSEKVFLTFILLHHVDYTKKCYLSVDLDCKIWIANVIAQMKITSTQTWVRQFVFSSSRLILYQLRTSLCLFWVVEFIIGKTGFESIFPFIAFSCVATISDLKDSYILHLTNVLPPEIRFKNKLQIILQRDLWYQLLICTIKTTKILLKDNLCFSFQYSI